MMSQNSLVFASNAACNFVRAGTEMILQLFRGADVNRGRDHIVARLSHVDVIVRVNEFARSNRFAG